MPTSLRGKIQITTSFKFNHACIYKFTHNMLISSDYRGAMGIMLVYDITNEKSFENIIKWLRNIDEHANEDVERMILGNKCDMTDKRVVSKERGEAVSCDYS